MSKVLLKSLLASPMVLGAAIAFSGPAMAATETVNEVAQATQATPQVSELPVTSQQLVAQAAPADASSSLDQVNRYAREGRQAVSIGQVTSVSQLTDVRPTDWAFQALQSLVERYGCIVGYPNKTYRGNQAMTRYEFAAGLNACMDKIQELIAAATADLVKKEDLLVLQKLQEEFAAELATLRGRVDALEARTATLEKQQFSTTTKIAGEAIFAITQEFGQRGNPIGANFEAPGGTPFALPSATRNGDNQVVFQDRVRLSLNTSFSGKDLLVTRIAAGNADAFNLNGGVGLTEGTQTFNFGNTGGNRAIIDWVAYYFPIGDNIQVYVPAVNGLHYDYVPTHAGLMENFDGGNGPLSLFAQRNPIYMVGGGAGVGVNFKFGQGFTFSAGYLADTANNPTAGNGLFNGSYAALAQIGYTADKFSVGLTYVNGYRQRGIFNGGGDGLSVVGSGLDNLILAGDKTSAEVNGVGLSAAYKLRPNISLNAFASWFDVNWQGVDVKDSNYWTYGLGVAIADIGKRGNLLGFSAGAEPHIAGFGKIPVHLEAFYKYQLTDNISITPGVVYIINASQDKISTDDVIIGTVRTTFTF